MEGDDNAARATKSLLFTLRLWSANEKARAPQWRVRLQNTHTGEVYYCGDARSLTALLDELLIELLKDKGKRSDE